MAKPLSENSIQRYHYVSTQVATLLYDWLDKLNDRRSPLTPATVAIVNRVLREARIATSRDVVVVYFSPLPLDGIVTPGDVVVALFQASRALCEYGCLKEIPEIDDDDNDW